MWTKKKKATKEKPLPKQCEVNRACEPESLFDTIEQCKLCGRCV